MTPRHILPILLSAALLAITACQDETSEIGSSLVTDKAEIFIDSLFTITGASTETGPVQSRTTLQLLGRLQNTAYGQFSSDFVTQFMAAEKIDTTGVTPDLIDSVRLIMRLPQGAYAGDSLAPMTITAYPLTRPLPSPIYSTFDPAGYYDPTHPLATGTYTMAPASTTTDKNNARLISLPLDRSLAVKWFETYRTDPASFAIPTTFTNLFPGVYVTTTFGNGRVAQIDSTVVTVYYRQRATINKTDTDGNTYTADTIYSRSQAYMAVTPEIVTNNQLKYTISPDLQARRDAGQALLVAPIGLNTRITLPARTLVERYRAIGSQLVVVNSLTLTIPAEEIAAAQGLSAPASVLLIKETEADQFFAQSKLPDNRTSFYATYDTYNRCYTFSDMRDYFVDLISADALPDDDTDGRFLIIPVTIAFESQASSTSAYYYYYGTTSTTTAVVSSVTPYVNSPAAARLNPADARLRLTYSVQTLAPESPAPPLSPIAYLPESGSPAAAAGLSGDGIGVPRKPDL